MRTARSHAKNGLEFRLLLASHEWVEWTRIEETTCIFLMECCSWWILAIFSIDCALYSAKMAGAGDSGGGNGGGWYLKSWIWSSGSLGSCKGRKVTSLGRHCQVLLWRRLGTRAGGWLREKRIQVSLTRTCLKMKKIKKQYKLTSSSPSHYLSIKEAMPVMSGDKGS